MDQRTFIRGALRTAGLVSAGGAGLLLRGSAKGGGAVRSIGRIRASRGAVA